MSVRRSLPVLLVLSALSSVAALDPNAGLELGTPAVKSLGALAWGPSQVLFIGDSEGGAIHAVQIEDAARGKGGPIELTGIDRRIADLLATKPEDIIIQDMAVHPVSNNVYLTITRGRGADARSVLLRVTHNNANPIEEFRLENVKYASAPIANAPAANPSARRDPRMFTVTDLAFADGQLYVAGLSNEEFSSAFRRMPYPFGGPMATTTLEIYHVSHGQNETNAPVMTFLPQRINGKLYMLAAYTCTPLVAFEADALKDHQHVFGRTVADLGAGNQPLDMISYTRAGQQNILIANSRHPLMRVTTADIASGPDLKNPTKDMGITRVPIAQQGIKQLADYDAEHVLVIQSNSNGGLDLRAIAKSTL